MKIKTITDGNHPVLIIQYNNQDFEPQKYCGYSWCNGKCGHPALVLKHDGRELKAYGSMVAIGHVFQDFRVEWIGEKFYVPNTLVDYEKLTSLLWL